MREIERKFLVKNLPPALDGYRRRVILQGYLVTEENDLEIRLRKSNENHYLTIKRKFGLDRDEFDIPLSEEKWRELWPLTEGRRLQKLRFDIPAGERTIELDVYQGQNDGFVVAEVEFPSIEAAREFAPPPWLGREVTGEPEYGNRRRAIEQ
jgi:CYTH domain-containing protein